MSFLIKVWKDRLWEYVCHEGCCWWEVFVCSCCLGCVLHAVVHKQAIGLKSLEALKGKHDLLNFTIYCSNIPFVLQSAAHKKKVTTIKLDHNFYAVNSLFFLTSFNICQLFFLFSFNRSKLLSQFIFLIPDVLFTRSSLCFIMSPLFPSLPFSFILADSLLGWCRGWK